MRSNKLVIVAIATLCMAGPPLFAADSGSSRPDTTGTANAVSRVENATTKHVDILTGLLTKVPEQAQASIQKAIAAAQKGHDMAIAALSSHGTGDGEETVTTASASGSPAAGGAPESTGLERARAAVASGFETSVATLQGLMEQVPSKATDRIAAALDRIQQNRNVALQNLDRLIAGEPPEHASVHRAEPPSALDRPDRPDRPERPERPSAADRPERPQMPERPTPPQG